MTGGLRGCPPRRRGVRLDGSRLITAAHWHPGQQVTVGHYLLDLAPTTPPDAALHPAEDGAGLDFNRPPRLLPPSPPPVSSCRGRRASPSGGRSRC